MNQVVPINGGGAFTPAQLSLIQRTVAKDCDATEFDHYMAVARALKLDPLRKQICAMVFNKNKPDKRSMSIIVQIDGFRLIAARAGDYRPMETAPIIETDEGAKDENTNPLGIVRAEVRVWKRHGAEWFPVTGEAYWSEFAPIEREWVECEDGKRRPVGKASLPDVSPWRRMPRVMIAKVAEAQALRRGWPDDLSGVYADEEMHQAQVIDVASEAVETYRAEQRMIAVGGKDAVTFQFGADAALERVPLGQLADRVIAFARACRTTDELAQFQRVNRAALQEFWARAPSDALGAKKEMEARAASLAKSDDFLGDRK